MLSHFSHAQLFATLWTAAHQASLSIGFSRQEYWSGLPFPSPGDLPDPGVEHKPPALQVNSLSLSHLGSPSICLDYYYFKKYLFIWLHLSCGLPKWRWW